MKSCLHSSVVFQWDISLWLSTGDVMLHSLRTRSLLRNVTAGLFFVTHNVCPCLCVIQVCVRACMQGVAPQQRGCKAIQSHLLLVTPALRDLGKATTEDI